MPKVSHYCGSSADLQSLRDRTVSVLDEARDRVQREQTELATEREAFEEFACRLDRIQPEAARRIPLGADRENTQEKPMRQVQLAYRETILSTPHFDREYNESYVENVRAELGNQLASVLDPADPAPFTPVLKQTLIQSVERCIAARSALLEDVEQELSSLSRARNQLLDFIDNIDGQNLQDIDQARIEELDAIAATRQELLHRPCSHRLFEDEHRLQEYLYSMKPWDFPVLLVIGRLREAGIR